MSGTTRFLKDHCKALMFSQFMFNSFKNRLEMDPAAPAVVAASRPVPVEKMPGEDLTIRLLLEMNGLAQAHGATFLDHSVVVQAARDDVWLDMPGCPPCSRAYGASTACVSSR